jgi:hypothetical protein
VAVGTYGSRKTCLNAALVRSLTFVPQRLRTTLPLGQARMDLLAIGYSLAALTITATLLARRDVTS